MPRVLEVKSTGSTGTRAFDVGRQVFGESIRDAVECRENIGKVSRERRGMRFWESSLAPSGLPANSGLGKAYS